MFLVKTAQNALWGRNRPREAESVQISTNAPPSRVKTAQSALKLRTVSPRYRRFITANVLTAILGQIVKKISMNVTQIPAKMEQHAQKALENTPVNVLLVSQEWHVKKTLTNVTQTHAKILDYALNLEQISAYYMENTIVNVLRVIPEQFAKNLLTTVTQILAKMKERDFRYHQVINVPVHLVILGQFVKSIQMDVNPSLAKMEGHALTG
jgi:hypothetical protein